MGEGRIIHAGSTRTRVTGNGKLKYQFQGYDEILTSNLVPLEMKATNAGEMVRLCNFTSPIIFLKGFTTERGERFHINRITIYVKPLWMEYPA